MAGSRPVAMYAMRVPPGNVLVPAVPEFAPMFRVTMAAIDPTEELDIEAVEDKQKPRATLKIVRIPDFDDSDDSDDDDESDEEGIIGGPSRTKTGDKDDDEDDDDDDDDDDDESMDDAEAEAVLAKLMGPKKKGKSKASDDDDEEDDEEDDEDDLEESLSMDECVLCTLDPEKNYQQPLDFHVAEGERVFFKVSGNLTVHLTGNYVMPLDDDESDEEDEDNEYDLSPYEDELDGLDALLDGDESDELDDLDDPRVMEIDNEEEEKPQTLPAPAKKGKNKRPAEDDADLDVSLDDIMAKSLKKDDAAPSEQPKKMTKAEKKAAKKLKNNEGEPAAAPAQSKKETAQSNGTPSSDSDKKKVQFAKNLEQGPTPSKTDAKAEAKADSKDKKSASVSLGVKDVNGVTVDDRKIGSGPAAKKGSRLEMRYIGKLDNGKVFDANKSGKPFSFKLGTGEVIKGWDIGLAGISTGGERRLIIPAHLAYGKKGVAGIPANSRLTFDIKCLSVK